MHDTDGLGGINTMNHASCGVIHAAQVGPACVSISAVGTSNGYGGGFFGALSGSAGSGVIVDGERGVVVTNAHVVAGAGFGGAPRNVTVQLQDGRTFKGIVVATDQPTDLAVVQLEPDSATAGVGASADAEGKGEGGLGLPSARFGSSAALRVGEFVVALGCPLLLRWSCSAGIVSALERTSAELGLQGVRSRARTPAQRSYVNVGGRPLLSAPRASVYRDRHHAHTRPPRTHACRGRFADCLYTNRRCDQPGQLGRSVGKPARRSGGNQRVEGGARRWRQFRGTL